MSGSTAKQKALEAIQKLPPDGTLQDAMERLVLLAKVERGLEELDADFLRLANALPALYPKGGEQKRHLDAMLLAVPR